MRIINYVSDDKSLTIRIEYRKIHQLKMYKGIGKSYPLHTQCIIEVNNLIKGLGTIVRHHTDRPNHRFSIIESTKLAMKESIRNKWLRQELWTLIFQMLDEEKEILSQLKTTKKR